MEQGLEIMLVGMATVFAFLALLVAMMYLSAALFAGQEVAPEPTVQSGQEDEDVAVVLAVAEAWRRRVDGEETG